MGETTGIGWCDHTFSSWRGCTKVSPACDFCYAEKRSLRFGTGPYDHGIPRVRASDAYWREPKKWDRAALAEGVRRRVFTASLSDVFDTEAPDAWRHDLFALISITPALDWLVLTKRAKVAAQWYDAIGCPPNVWAGVSVESQKMARARIPYLLKIDARVRFLSVEPMLEPIDLGQWLDGISCMGRWRSTRFGPYSASAERPASVMRNSTIPPSILPSSTQPRRRTLFIVLGAAYGNGSHLVSPFGHETRNESNWRWRRVSFIGRPLTARVGG